VDGDLLERALGLIPAARGVRNLISALRRRGVPIAPLIATLPAAIYLAAIFAVPVLRVLALSLFDPNFTLEHYRRMIEVPIYRAVMLTTVEISATVSFICLLIAYPTAYMLVTIRRQLSRILILAVMVPFFTSALVRNYAWIFLLGSHGVVNSTLLRLGLVTEPLPLIFNRAGVLIGMVNVLLPYTILVLLSVMRGIRRDLLQAAESLMASPVTAFRRVFLPLSLPGVGASFLLVFVLALAFFITPAMLGGAHDVMISNIIANVTAALNWGFASALSMVLLAVSLVVIALTQYLFGGVGLLAGNKGAGLRTVRARRSREGAITVMLDRVLEPLWPHIFYVIGGAALAFLVVPVVIMVPLSFSSAAYFVFPPPGWSLQWYEKYLTGARWLDATWHSLEIGALTTILALLLSVPAALGIARLSSRIGTALYMWILAPLIMPSIVIAVSVFYLLSKLGLTYTVLGVALGHMILALPMATVVLSAGLRNFDRSLERAAISLGASPVRTTVRVTLPIISTTVFTAALFAFLQSFEELLIALFVSGIDAGTLPKKMWESLQELDPTIAAVSTLLVTFSISALAAMFLVHRLAKRRTIRASALGAFDLAPGALEGRP
jgi:putative spermidine/putrescine transport system permease protein